MIVLFDDELQGDTDTTDIPLKPYIRRTSVGHKIVGHSDAAGASPIGAAPTTSSFST